MFYYSSKTPSTKEIKKLTHCDKKECRTQNKTKDKDRAMALTLLPFLPNHPIDFCPTNLPTPPNPF
jgi:hypothetical protein